MLHAKSRLPVQTKLHLVIFLKCEEALLLIFFKNQSQCSFPLVVGLRCGQWLAVAKFSRSTRDFRLTFNLHTFSSEVELWQLAGHSGEVTGVAVSSDGCLIASGSRDGTVRLWDGATGVPTSNHPNVTMSDWSLLS